MNFWCWFFAVAVFSSTVFKVQLERKSINLVPTLFLLATENLKTQPCEIGEISMNLLKPRTYWKFIEWLIRSKIKFPDFCQISNKLLSLTSQLKPDRIKAQFMAPPLKMYGHHFLLTIFWKESTLECSVSANAETLQIVFVRVGLCKLI